MTIDSADPLVRFFAERGISLPDKPLTLLDDPAPREVWCPVISVDDHAMEPPTLFDGIPARFADQAPKIVDYEGRPVWLIEDDIIPIIGANAASGRPMTEYQQLALRFEEMRPGVYDPARRLADMDLNGVWASLCFPSMPWGFAAGDCPGSVTPNSPSRASARTTPGFSNSGAVRRPTGSSRASCLGCAIRSRRRQRSGATPSGDSTP